MQKNQRNPMISFREKLVTDERTDGCLKEWKTLDKRSVQLIPAKGKQSDNKGCGRTNGSKSMTNLPKVGGSKNVSHQAEKPSERCTKTGDVVLKPPALPDPLKIPQAPAYAFYQILSLAHSIGKQHVKLITFGHSQHIYNTRH